MLYNPTKLVALQKVLIKIEQGGFMLSLLVFILLLSIIVLVHEIGHFTIANMFGASLTTINIGFLRPIVKFQISNVELVFRALPLGGYVECQYFTEGKMAYLRDVLTLLGGCASNIILAIIAAAIGYALPSHHANIEYRHDGVEYQFIQHNNREYITWSQLNTGLIISQLSNHDHQFVINDKDHEVVIPDITAIILNTYLIDLDLYPLSPHQKIIIDSPLVDSCEYKAPFLPGKYLYAVQGKRIMNQLQLRYSLMDAAANKEPAFVTVTDPGGKFLTKPVAIGSLKKGDSEITSLPYRLKAQPLSIHSREISVAIYAALLDVQLTISMYFHVFFGLLTGQVALSDLAGPVGLFSKLGDFTQYYTAADYLLLLSAFNLLLAAFNLLPLPPLDGGIILLRTILHGLGPAKGLRWAQLLSNLGVIALAQLIIYATLSDIGMLGNKQDVVFTPFSSWCDHGEISR